MQPLRVTFAHWCRKVRIERGLTQQQVAEAVGLARGYIATIESGRANPSLQVVTRIAERLGLEVELLVRPPLVIDGGLGQRDLVHARCSAYVDRRLRGAGLQTAREVEIVHARSHGWIDLLAFDPIRRMLLIIEVKTRLDDLGALERQIGWYERSAIDAAHRLGWQPARVVTWLLALASTDVESVIRANRAIFDDAFPVRAQGASAWLADVDAPMAGRVVALIDPSSRRREWLLRTRFDGRRSDAPYRDYADAAARSSASR